MAYRATGRMSRAILEVRCPVGCDRPGARAYVSGPLRAIVSREDGAWRVSVSHRSRTPTDDEVYGLARGILPGVLFAEASGAGLNPHTRYLREVAA